MGHSHFKLYHPDLVPLHITNVVDIINWSTSSWDSHTVGHCFSLIDAERISKIPLHPYPMDDKLAWMPALAGQFTVKGAYWFGYHLSQLTQNQVNASTCKYSSVYWNKLWGSPLLPRIIVWAWQASCDRLPTALNLHKRNLLTHANFTFCNLT